MPARGVLTGGLPTRGIRDVSFSEMFILLEPFSMGVMGEWVFHCFFVLIKTSHSLVQRIKTKSLIGQ